jgi:hypothetical protein
MPICRLSWPVALKVRFRSTSVIGYRSHIPSTEKMQDNNRIWQVTQSDANW